MLKTRFFIGEGSDGVGKTTQLLLLAKRLTALGYNVKVTKALGGDGTDPIQLELRKMLLAPTFPADRTMVEERLFAVADLANLEQMEDFLAADPRNVVVADRGYISHIAYFAAKGFEDVAINRVHLDLFQEYATIARRYGILSIVLIPEDENMAMERVASRGQAVTPRLENAAMQKAVIEQLKQGDSLLTRFPRLDVPGLQNLYITVTRQMGIEQVEAAVATAILARAGVNLDSYQQDAQVVS